MWAGMFEMDVYDSLIQLSHWKFVYAEFPDSCTPRQRQVLARILNEVPDDALGGRLPIGTRVSRNRSASDPVGVS